MICRLALLVLVFLLAMACGLSKVTALDNGIKERTGTVIGELKSRKGIMLEILGDGEEKARIYLVPSGPNAKGPLAKVLPAVNAAQVGDRVQCDWSRDLPRSEGNLFVTTFKVLRKANVKKGDGKDK